ncbi:unnamed protein product, partial [marine sediment metagenome]
VEKTYKRISSGALYGGTVLISAMVLLFYIIFNELTKVGIGSFIGSGDIGINIPGESSDIIASSTWGPTIGFILCVVSMILLIISSYLHIKIVTNKTIQAIGSASGILSTMKNAPTIIIIYSDMV